MPSSKDTSQNIGMAFKVRRVTSGLSPYTTSSATKEIAEPRALSGQTPTSSVRRGTVLGSSTRSVSGLQDRVQNEDSEVETPTLLRKRNASFTTDDRFPVFDGLRSNHQQSESGSPTKVSTTKTGQPTFIKAAEKTKHNGTHPTPNDYRTFIRENKLIDDNNVFSPRKATLTAPNSKFHAARGNVDSNDIEFDSSDHESPIKSSNVVGHRINSNIPNQTPLIPSPAKAANLQSDPLPTDRDFTLHTPRRSSPLRKEIIQSSERKSSTSDLLNEIQKSGAVRSKSTSEILEQINSSMDRLKKSKEHSNESSYLLDSSDSPSKSEREILENLDRLLPELNKGSKDKVQEHVASKRNHHASPSDEHSPFQSHFVASIDQTDQNGDHSKKEVPRKSKKLSGKYARSVLRKKSVIHSEPKVPNWSFEKWDKLKRLVESSIPNSVIINNEIVMKELGCKSKHELAQRVRFLSRGKR